MTEQLYENFYNDVRKVFTEQIPRFGGFSLRQGQLDMALAAAESLVSNKYLCVQAGTGVGKTLAYLIPSVIWRMKYNSGPIIISTYTNNLQQQIAEKDYPFVCNVLNMPFKLMQALGRSKYLCLDRLYKLLRRSRFFYKNIRILLECIAETAEYENYALFNQDNFEEQNSFKGTISELRRICSEKVQWQDSVWDEICCDSMMCSKKCCRYYKRCFFYRERSMLSCADICIANHALICSLMLQGGISCLIPNVSACVIDEAHHFEDVAGEQAANYFDSILCKKFLGQFANKNYSLEISSISDFIDKEESEFEALNLGIADGIEDPEIQKNTLLPSGWFSEAAEALESFSGFLYSDEKKRFKSSLLRLYSGAYSETENTINEFLDSLDAYYKSRAYEVLECFEKDSNAVLLNEHWLTQTGEYGKNLFECGCKLEESLKAFESELTSLDSSWTRISDSIEIPENNLKVLIKNGLDSFDKFFENFKVCFHIEAYSDIRGFWMEYSRGRVCLKSALIDMSEFLYNRFFMPMPSVIMTSATLAADSSFEFFKSRAGINRFPEEKQKDIIVASPFKYREQARIGIVSDCIRYGNSSEEGALRRIAWFIGRVCRRWQGRTLVLATSKTEVNMICDILSEPLSRYGITVLRQSSGMRNEQVGRMRSAESNNEKVVLVGTSSFWEGVDVPGSALSCVIIMRLPFTRPNDPLFKIRSKHLGSEAFKKYALPLAVIKFCQGVGRLVRTEEDRGTVFILDNRIDWNLGKNYGGKFLKSLPPYGVFCEPSAAVIESGWRWFVSGEEPADTRFFGS